MAVKYLQDTPRLRLNNTEFFLTIHHNDGA